MWKKLQWIDYRISTEVRACLSLAIPLAGAQLAQAATGFADTVMMGVLGSQSLAAGGLGAGAFTALIIIVSGIVSAVSPLVAEAYGSGRRDRVGQITNQGLWLSLLIGIPLSVLIWHLGAFMPLLGQEEANVLLAEQYLKAIAWGFWPGIAFAALRSFVAAMAQPRPVMVITVLGTAINIVGNYVLSLGKFGFPALGLGGIGLASAMSLWFMFLAIAGYILVQPNLNTYGVFRKLRFNAQMLWEVVQVGVPIGVLFAVETGLFTITTFLMGQLGTVTLAAHQVALQTAALTFMVTSGISLATTVRVGHFSGQEDWTGARLAGYVGMALGAAFMACMGLLFWTLPGVIVSLYLNPRDPANLAVAEMAMSLLSVAALFQIVDGVQAIAAGALRGLRDTRIPMLIGIFAYWCVGLTSSYLLCFRLNWDGFGLWLGLAAGLAVAAIVLGWRFHHLIDFKMRQPLMTR